MDLNRQKGTLLRALRDQPSPRGVKFVESEGTTFAVSEPRTQILSLKEQAALRSLPGTRRSVLTDYSEPGLPASEERAFSPPNAGLPAGLTRRS